MNAADLLEEFRKDFVEVRGGNPRFVKSVQPMWEYLVNTPGEQRPYAEFGEMFGIGQSAAFSRIKTLMSAGVLVRTSGRRGHGGGAGFICEWLEERRQIVRGAVKTRRARASEPDHAQVLDGVCRSVQEELDAIDAMAERGIQSMRLLGDRVSLAMIETLREIQVRVSRISTELAKQ